VAVLGTSELMIFARFLIVEIPYQVRDDCISALEVWRQRSKRHCFSPASIEECHQLVCAMSNSATGSNFVKQFDPAPFEKNA